ncbi:unnamed protein product [Discula destructiva]
MEKLDHILESFVAGKGERASHGKLLGAAFVVVNKDGVIYEGAAGRIHSDLDAAQFSVDSCSWIASMTKIVTSAAVMRIVEDGLVGLDDDVRRFVPQLAKVQILRGFVGNDIPYLLENNVPITLRQLLTHTSGFGYANGDPDLIRWANHTGRKEEDLQGDAEAWNVPLKFAPGRGWYYGTGCDWAGQVVEKLTKQTLGEFMLDNIFQPLGMRSTTFNPDALPHIQDCLVPTASRDAGTGELISGDRPSTQEGTVNSGGAGLYTTAADFSKLLQSFLVSLAGQAGLLKQETVEEMLRPQLVDVQSRELNFLADLFHDGMAPDFEPGMPLNHGISGVINLEDAPAKRKKGSMMWGGLCNGHWFVDRNAGIGATFITNVLPHPDAVATRAWDQLERAVYSDLMNG